MSNQPSMQLVPSSPPLFASYHNRGFENVVVDEHQQHNSQQVALTSQSDFLGMQQNQLELAPSMTQQRSSYSYPDPYYNNLVTYGTQTMIPAQLMSIQQARMPLPSELLEEEPVYVNAKQYHGILRRRQSRAKAEMENKVVKTRKPYLHESRHRHALRRARGCGGRFLNTKTKDKEQGNTSSQSDQSKADRKSLTKSASQTSSDNNTNFKSANGKSNGKNNTGASSAPVLSDTSLQLNSNSLSSEEFDIQNGQTFSLPVNHVYSRQSGQTFDSQLFGSQPSGASYEGTRGQSQTQAQNSIQLFNQQGNHSFEPQTQALLSDNLNQEIGVNHVYPSSSVGLTFPNSYLSTGAGTDGEQLSSGLQFHASAFHPISNNGDVVNVVPGSLHDYKN